MFHKPTETRQILPTTFAKRTSKGKRNHKLSICLSSHVDGKKITLRSPKHFLSGILAQSQLALLIGHF